jgi:DNA-binding response OmpR family regulator
VRVLVAEDEKKMAKLLRKALEEQRHSVMVAEDGREALELALNYPFDVVVLDVMLPEIDGFEVARKLRIENRRVPILFLTARDAKTDLVRGLDLGGDDYLTKPFSFAELFARLRSLARRGPASMPAELRIAGLILNPATHEVSRDGRPINLTRTEYQLLEFFMRNVDRVLLREVLIEAVWGVGATVGMNTVDAFIKTVRKKIDSGHEVRLIHTVRGFGYRLGTREDE